MELLVIRHGVAEEKETFAATGQADSLRRTMRDHGHPLVCHIHAGPPTWRSVR